MHFPLENEEAHQMEEFKPPRRLAESSTPVKKERKNNTNSNAHSDMDEEISIGTESEEKLATGILEEICSDTEELDRPTKYESFLAHWNGSRFFYP